MIAESGSESMANEMLALPKNLYKGDTCIIIGNGVSLGHVPLGLLNRYDSFGCNGIYMLEDFTPTYYSVVGFNHLDTPEKRGVVFPMIESCRAVFVNRKFVQHFRWSNVFSLLSHISFRGKTVFSFDPLDYIGVRATQTFISLQLAYWLGYKKVFLVGIDNDYTSANRHFYSDEDRPEFPTGERDLVEGKRMAAFADETYKASRLVYEKDGREILNLTRQWGDTSTDVFEEGMYAE